MNKFVTLPNGTKMPMMGQGTWTMGQDDAKAQREVDGLRHGIDIGLTLIDTAELYDAGKAELIVGKAIEGLKREDLFIVSKVLPENGFKEHMRSSLEKSMKLIGTDYLDLYLLHWRVDNDLAEVVDYMERFVKEDLIKAWGVSNFDVDDMEDLWAVENGSNCQVNQILYNLGSREIESELLAWQREKGVPFMAFTPVGSGGASVTPQGREVPSLKDNPTVKMVAERKGVSPIQLLLAWDMRLGDMVVIPKSISPEHIDANAAAMDIVLTDEDLADLDKAFPAPAPGTKIDKW